MKEACGVFGVFAPGRPVAQLVYDGLYALQHRGQESAGMAVSDGETVTVVKDMGLVSAVFDERTLSCLPGSLAIGHTRYSTSGPSTWRNAQPVYRSVGRAGFALGHNGNLTNTIELGARAGMLEGVMASDSDLVAELLAQAFPPVRNALETLGCMEVPRAITEPISAEVGAEGSTKALWQAAGDGDLEGALCTVLPSLEGAFSFVALDAGHLFAVRDPSGFRPLCLGRLGGADAAEGWAVASETPALDVVGASFVREVSPGEMLVIDIDGVRSLSIFDPAKVNPRLCIFEFVYFARPDAVLYGKEVHGARRRMGERLASQRPVQADLVMGVPDSGVPAAEGYARASGIAYGQGLVKNRYIGRTFISPTQEARDRGVRRKLNPLKENIAGKRLVVVDDSIVRGTTTRAMVRMLRDAGAEQIHLRISSPPFRWPCFYGIDTPDRDQLLAAKLSPSQVAGYLGADSVDYLTLENLVAAIGVPGAGFCDACLSGEYPVRIPVDLRRRRLEAPMPAGG